MEILDTLFSLRDEKYKDFSASLMPTVDKERVIGVRIPILRKLAKELKGTNTAESFLKTLPHKYYEENNLPCGDLNSHNQFIDTTISIGILGLLSLLSYFIVPIILSIKNRQYNFAFLLFLFMTAFNSVFEAVFESQTGILFFNFIFCMFFFTSFVQKQDKTQ
jgi:hypothetical protein